MMAGLQVGVPEVVGERCTHQEQMIFEPITLDNCQ